jgi:DNA-binding transcriptional LysR family regulator
MRYQFDQIEAFLQVLEAGSISAAAERLNLAKSAVSKRLAALERTLGVELVRRSARGIVPTERGRFFYARARALFQQIDNTVEEMSETGALSGPMRITVPMSCGALGLSHLLFSFASRHPRLELALDFDDSLADLLHEGYDLAIRITRLKDSSLIAKKLMVSRRVICCSPAYAQHFGLPKKIEDLQKHSCIGTTRSNHMWEFEGEGNGENVVAVVRSRVVTNNADAMRDAAIAGLGIAILPALVANAPLASGQLMPVLPSARPTDDTIYAMYPRSHVPSRKVTLLTEFLVQTLRKGPAELQLPPAPQSTIV